MQIKDVGFLLISVICNKFHFFLFIFFNMLNYILYFGQCVLDFSKRGFPFSGLRTKAVR
jgi:hypothetical protein